MERERHIFRTSAYRFVKDGKEHLIFWTIDPSYWHPDKSYIREHDLYPGGSMSRPVTEELPHREAIKRIAEIEKEAAEHLLPAGLDFLHHPFIGATCRDASPWREHPAHLEEKEDALQRLRTRRPPGFGLK